MTGRPTPVPDELRAATARLAASGIDSARRDAEWLLAHVLGIDAGRLVLVDAIDDAPARAFRSAIDLRSQRIPLQHIIGTAAFGPVELAVGPGVFIPRPETEYLLEWAVDRLRATPGPHSAADFCSGSGALAIGIAAMSPATRVVAVEADEDALVWLRRNVAAATPAGGSRVDVVAADVTDPDQVAGAIPAGSVSVLVTNPPYVPLDAVVADFMAGSVEWLTPDNDADHWDLIEGQGSLFHPSYSGVTMALVHGGQPDALILCHEPTREHMRGLPGYRLPSLEAVRDMALELARVANPGCKVVGVSINTQHLGEEEAVAYMAEVEARLGLPTVDPFRQGAARLVDALEQV